MWLIFEHRRLDQRLRSLPVEIIKRSEKWKDIVHVSGPAGLKTIRGFNDEALKGEWRGCRSSRLGHKYRVIYRVESAEIRVLVIDLTPHDYRKK